MCSFFCENLCSKSFPYCDWKFIKRRDSGNKSNTGWSGDSEPKLSSDQVIRDLARPIGSAAARSSRTISKAMIECRRRFFLVELLFTTRFTIRILITETAGHRKRAAQVVWPFHSKWSVDTLPLSQKFSLQCKLRLHVAITSRPKASFIL